MSLTRRLGVLLFLVGTVILANQVITRAGGESLAEYRAERVGDTGRFRTEFFRLPQVEKPLEFFLIVERDQLFEPNTSFLSPTFRLVSVDDEVTWEGDVTRFSSRTAPLGRTIAFVVGEPPSIPNDAQRFEVTLEERLVRSDGTVVRMEAREHSEPKMGLTGLAAATFALGVGVLFATRP